MLVVRRTFEALKHQKGSDERAYLNLDWLTSEYMPSYRYGLREDDGSRGGSSYVFRTRLESEEKAVSLRLAAPDLLAALRLAATALATIYDASAQQGDHEAVQAEAAVALKASDAAIAQAEEGS